MLRSREVNTPTLKIEVFDTVQNFYAYAKEICGNSIRSILPTANITTRTKPASQKFDLNSKMRAELR